MRAVGVSEDKKRLRVSLFTGQNFNRVFLPIPI